MEFTSVGYWVLGFMNGYIVAEGEDRLLRLSDKGVGGAVVSGCRRAPHESLASVVEDAAEDLAD